MREVARERRQIIESKIIDSITGYVNERKETIEQLSADQIKVIKDILKEMENSEWSIRLIGCVPWLSIAMYFQCGTEPSIEAFEGMYQTGRLKELSNRLCHCLLELPEVECIIERIDIIENSYRLSGT